MEDSGHHRASPTVPSDFGNRRQGCVEHHCAVQHTMVPYNITEYKIMQNIIY